MSKFSGLLRAKQVQSLPPSEEESVVVEVESKLEEAIIDHSNTAQAVINMQPSRAKKGHPDYNQVTVYLKKDTHNRAKIALLQSGTKKEFSQLVEELLSNWLEAKTEE